MDNTELVDALCKASVRLREARRMHLRDYGILLPHVFMGEVHRLIDACWGIFGSRGI